MPEKAALIWATASGLSLAAAAIASARDTMASLAAICFGSSPIALPMAARCAAISSVNGTPGPANMTTKAIFGSPAATIGAIIPPSLWPISPTRSGAMSFRARRVFTAARMSSAKSAIVADAKLPPEPPAPRSSSRSTATPRRVRASAITAKGR